MIAKGEIELGLMNASEVRIFVKFGGSVPAPLQDYTSYEVALTAKAAESGAALALARSVHRWPGRSSALEDSRQAAWFEPGRIRHGGGQQLREGARDFGGEAALDH
jgi:hypothetical protein